MNGHGATSQLKTFVILFVIYCSHSEFAHSNFMHARAPTSTLGGGARGGAKRPREALSMHIILTGGDVLMYSQGPW